MAHSYWRLYIGGNNGDTTFTAVGEIEMRATSGGADQCSGGTATASTLGNPASAAFDNVLDSSGASNTTYWTTTAGNYAPCWVAYQFASPVDVTEISVGCARDVTRAPMNMRVEYSDNGTTWTTAWTIRAQTNWTLGEARVFTDPGSSPKTFGLLWGGNTSANTPLADNKSGTVYTLSEAASVSKISGLYDLTNGTVKARGLIYSVSGGLPAALVATSNERTGVAVGWNDFTFASPVSLAAGDYWLGVIADQSITMPSAAGSGASFNSDTYADGASNPFGTASSSSYQKPLYATYTTSTPTVTGTGSATLEALVGAASGTATPPTVTGTAASPLEDLTGAASGAATTSGAGASTLADLAGTGAGVMGTPVTGTGTASLADLAGAASGVFTAPITGTGTASLETLTSAGSGLTSGATKHRIGLHATWVNQPT